VASLGLAATYNEIDETSQLRRDADREIAILAAVEVFFARMVSISD
jgi:hypothetical protein